VFFWLARTYARQTRPADGLSFDRTLLPTVVLAGFMGGKSLRADQIELLSLIVDHLTEHGCMEAKLLRSWTVVY
ncbi:MAG: hypothetical protein AAB397_00720, partial [Patescibacteria group bacterium]